MGVFAFSVRNFRRDLGTENYINVNARSKCNVNRNS